MNKFFVNRWLDFFSDAPHIENSTILASCVVTDRAKKKWIKEVLQILQEKEHIYITGCGVLDRGKLIEEKIFYTTYPELVTYKDRITLLPEAPEKVINEHSLGGSVYTRKFIVIQNGCDNYCTFCLTVLKRGNHRSRPIEEILKEITEFEKYGGKEIILTGVNLAARGASNSTKVEESTFVYLLQEILDKTTIPRIRISSLGPEYLTDEFFILMNNKRFVPHFHLSLQHFSDNVLEAMRRNYDSKQINYVLEKLRNLERDDKKYISIGADVIVGFPGETEKDFEIMLAGIEKYGITKLHAFPFSAHKKGDTVPASKLPDQIPAPIKKEREEKLLTLGEQVRNTFLEKNKGIKHQVLLEKFKDGKWIGWTGNYIQAELEGNYKRGDIVETIL